MTIAEALSILGNPEPGKQSVLKAYRIKAKQYHPDHKNGDLELMKLVNIAFQTLEDISFQWTSRESENGKRTAPLTETISALWDQIKHYQGISGEIIGSWLWITGNTYPIKDYLKNLGFRFAHYKQAWYYHDGDYWKRSRRKFDLEDLRGMWGVEELDKEEAGVIEDNEAYKGNG